jgi:hypothetical protein
VWLGKTELGGVLSSSRDRSQAISLSDRVRPRVEWAPTQGERPELGGLTMTGTGRTSTQRLWRSSRSASGQRARCQRDGAGGRRYPAAAALPRSRPRSPGRASTARRCPSHMKRRRAHDARAQVERHDLIPFPGALGGWFRARLGSRRPGDGTGRGESDRRDPVHDSIRPLRAYPRRRRGRRSGSTAARSVRSRARVPRFPRSVPTPRRPCASPTG